MATDKQPNFSAAQEQRIRDVAAAGPDGKLNLDGAKALATEMGKSYRSIIAKANRMNVPYARKQPTTKSGERIVKKETLVSEIADLLDVEASALDGLEKAQKATLQTLHREVRRLVA